MTADKSVGEGNEVSSLAILKEQRSHVLFVLCNSKDGCDATFLEWYQGACRRLVLQMPGVLSAQHYEQHEMDITRGRYAPLGFHYLGLYELSLDGAKESASLMARITMLYREHASAQAPATWLYYPVTEKVGRPPAAKPSMLTLAFANGMPGQEDEFFEWYITRHIRHALNIPALVSGQCLQRTAFQQPGALDAIFSMIAVYEQEGSPESIIQSFASLPEGTLHFPTLDRSRFTEWVYRPV